MAGHLAPPLPPDVARAVTDRWPDRAEQWCVDIAPEFRQLCHRYDAVPLSVMSGRYAFVVSVSTRHGRLSCALAPTQMARIKLKPRSH
jgi:hypothetical protein